jgi:hypothetical protein
MIVSHRGSSLRFDSAPSIVFRPLRMHMPRSSIHRVYAKLWPAFATILIALGVLGLAACGASSHNSHQGSSLAAATTIGAPPPNLVTQQQIAAYPAGSPPHALLEFWQALQFSDAPGARSLVAPQALAVLTPARFKAMIQTVGDDVPGLRIVNTTQTGADASVRVFLLLYARNRTLSASTPQTFSLREGPHGYQLSDLSYFQRVARAIVAAQNQH